ncbi:arginase 2, chloroplastic/mitochondrial isoform X1 [Lathyrus oleraceus]|uniref:arginase 2, chloroplastic/mitochondrial isoform X1 n=1 Tax=Pisum sativum TaxID=3888 RepID=UPI0021D162AB|nr:arginase 2, chloroplastic/mitochondrial-like isoform X1 [Pisum sativum]XP_050899666.1 arginase 2, chloroplastic/mitochondrial-like isoform X1 [Pisum sativum]XP_050899667.1 arginase 2, chloroplastic/mitochondrial-like isoform X1 [Pisum sativum]
MISSIAPLGSSFAQAQERVTKLTESGQDEVINASLKFLKEKAKLKGETANGILGGAIATSTILGVPLGHNGSYHEGPTFAPPLVREAIWNASTNSTTEEGKNLVDPRVFADVGDIPIQDLRNLGISEDRLMNFVSDSVKIVMDHAPLRPLIVGGDHSITFPVVRAISEKLGGPVDILHFDAHPDIYENFDNNYYSHASPFARIMEGKYAKRLVQVGIRSINDAGRQQIEKYGVETHEMRNFAKDRDYLENLTLGTGEGVKGVYVSIDVDSLDPGFAPGVSHIESGGLSFRDILNILQNLKGNIVGGDVVEFNPILDVSNRMTSLVAAKLVRELAAKMSK